jgi:hypothetical protein
MQINVTYDSSVDDAPAAFKVDVQYAVSVLDVAFSNNVTLNIHVGWGEVGGLALQSTDLGESETAVAPKYTYSQIVGALQQAASQPNASPDLVAAAQTLVGLPDPTDGGPFDIGLAEAQALGLAPNNPTANDGWVGFAANASEWSYSTTATPASNKYYLVGTILHEITEVMGRDSDIGKAGDHYSDAWGVPDLFRFSGGQRSDSPGPGHSTAYFSIDNGTTVLGVWNNHAGSDFGDWNANGNQAGGGGTGPSGNDSFNDFSDPGVLNQITNTDLTLMHVLGWTPSEPENFVLKGEMYYVQSGQVEQDPLLIMAHGTVDIADGGSVTGTITFQGEGGLLTIEGDTPLTNTIGGFKAGDTIDFSGAPIGTHPTITLLADNVLQIVEHGQTYDFQFDPSQDFSGQKFVVTDDGSGGTEIYIEPTLTTVGNPSPGSSPSSNSISVTGPDITNGSGDINADHVVTFTLNMNTDIVVDTTNGTPTLSLNDGEVATYSGGSGSQALTFTYTVANGDNTPALAITGVNLNGGTVQDVNGHDADLSGAVGPLQGNLQIDTTPPSLTGVNMSGSSWVLSFSEPVVASGTPTLDLLGRPGGYDANATAALHDPTKAVFDFSSSSPAALPAPGHELTGITDLAGNAATVDLATAVHTNPVFAVLLIFTEIAAEYAAGHSQVEEAGNQQAAGLFHLLV